MPTKKVKVTETKDLAIGTTLLSASGTALPSKSKDFPTVSVARTMVTGTDTDFTVSAKVGSQIAANGELHNVSAIISNTELTTDAWITEATDVVYVIIK